MVDFAPSRETDFDPKQSVTVVEDINNLFNQNLSDKDFITEAKNIIPTFTDEMSKEYLKGNPLQRIEMMNILANKHEDKVLLENKINYITSLLPEGNTVENKGLDFTKDDIILQDRLSRSKLFVTRKKKFLEEYPNGVYTTLSLPIYDGETVEIFKKNQNDTEWNFRLPYGRDKGELGVATGNLLNFRTLADVAAGIKYAKGGFKSFVGLVAADYFGQQLDKTTEQFLGYGEREYAGEPGVDTITNYFTNILSNDMKEAGITGGVGIALNRGINWFTKSDRSLFGLFGTSDKAKDFVGAFDNLQKQGYNVDPLVYAQIAGWPILRSTFFQAKDFVKEPKSILDQQALSLYQNFKKFGVELGKDTVEGSSKINHSQLTQIKQQFELEMGDLLKSVANETDAAAANIKFLNFFKKWDETATAQESILKNAANDMSKLQGINYNLNPVKSEAKKIIKELNIYGPAKAPTKTQLKVAEEQGVKLSKTVKLDKPASDELTSLLDDINKLDGTLIRAGGGNKAWSEATDQIFALRKRALELTTHPDKNVRNAGLRLYEKIKNQYSKPKGGSEEFDLAWKTYIQQVDSNDLIRQTTMMKEALRTGNLDAVQFVSTYLNPNLPDTASLISKMVTKEQGDNIKDAFILNLTGDLSSFSKNFDQWIAKNPEGITSLLGEDVVKQLSSLKVIVDKFDTGLVNKALQQADDFSAEAFVNFITREGTKNNISSNVVIKNLINDLGGFDSPALDEIRSGIIANILKNSRDTSAKSVDIVGDTLDPVKFYKEIGKIEEGPLKQFFNADHLEVVKNFDLYTKAITAAGDIGGPVAAGSLRGEIASLPTQPTKAIKVAKHLLGYKFIAYILGKKQHAAVLKDLDGNIFTEKGLGALRNVAASQLGDTIGVGSFGIDDPDAGTIVDFAPSKISTSGQTVNPPVDDAVRKIPEMSIENFESFSPQASLNLPTVNSASRLANTNLAAADPNTMDRGKQLFGGPNEITFASKGGIMNARKIMQRVI
tara:strand:+ start:7082 stop:10096 length:3015 start_codon:yes stop_codon:yes gene_type:complete